MNELTIQEQISNEMNAWMKDRQMTAADVANLQTWKDAAHFDFNGNRWKVRLTKTGKVQKGSSDSIDLGL